MKVYSVKKLIAFARRTSKFYKQLYKHIKGSKFHFTDLPVINESAFWKANSQKYNQVITQPQPYGMVLSSGGTTGKPKNVVFSKEEWNGLCTITASKLHQSKLIRNNDRIANLFCHGTLHGSFLHIHTSLFGCPSRFLQLPIGMGEEYSVGESLEENIQERVNLITQFNVNVLVAPSFVAVMIAYYIYKNKITGIHLDRILYGAQTLRESQYQFLQKVFPKTTITSFGYAGTDSGFIGYSDSTCQLNEHRTDPRLTLVEIVDGKTGKVIEEPNIRGRLIVTNLTKTLLPVIRYPVGDFAMWREPKGSPFRKLKLLGRHTIKSNLLKVRDNDYSVSDFYDVLEKSKFIDNILAIQMFAKGKKAKMKVACLKKENGNKIKRHIIYSIPGINPNLFDVELVSVYDLKLSLRTFRTIDLIKE
jgi:phenylacetate-CoA ligase